MKNFDNNIADIYTTDTLSTDTKEASLEISIIVDLKTGISSALFSKENLKEMISTIEKEEEFIKENGHPSYIEIDEID